MMDVGAQSIYPVWPIITSPKRLSLTKLITCLPVPTFLGTKCLDGWRGYIEKHAGGGGGVYLEGDGGDLFLWSRYRQTIHRRKWWSFKTISRRKNATEKPHLLPFKYSHNSGLHSQLVIWRSVHLFYC